MTKLVVTNNDIWALTVNVTKASILMQYLRLFSAHYTRLLTYLLLTLLPPAALWAILGGTLRCRPIAKLWSPQIEGHCLMPASGYWISVAAIDIALDFLIIALPLPAITAMRCLPRKQKISLIAVFALGFFVCATSIARLATVTTTSKQGDFVASGVWAIVWSTVEANVGIICACLLALRPLLAKIYPGMDRHETNTAAAGSLSVNYSHRQHPANLGPTAMHGNEPAMAWPGDEATLVPPDTPMTVKDSEVDTLKRASGWSNETFHARKESQVSEMLHRSSISADRVFHLQRPPPPAARREGGVDGGDGSGRTDSGSQVPTGRREVVGVLNMLRDDGDGMV